MLEEIKKIDLINVASRDDFNVAINRLDKKIDASVAALDKKIDDNYRNLDKKIDAAKFDLIKWIVPIMLSNSALIVALIKFL